MSARPVTTGLLISAMAFSVFPVVAVSVLSSAILHDLGIGRTELGIVVAAAYACAAVASVALGRLADRLGGRNALIVVFGLGALAMGGIAVAPTYPVLACAAALAGLTMGISNPATNRLVVDTVPPAQRGTIIGVKQAGEAAAIVACGALLPIAALVIGWRWAFAVTALAPCAAILVAFAAIPISARREAPAVARVSRRRFGSDVYWLAAYSTVVGLAGGSVSTYLPLYSQEALEMSPSAAGLIVAGMGVVAVIGRVAWGHAARGTADLRGRLRSMAQLGVGAAIPLWAASVVHPSLVLIGAVVWGASILSVVAVANLAVMRYSAVEETGQASGVMLAGLYAGFVIGPPAFGWSVDTTGAYDAGWGLVIAELMTLTAIGFVWSRRGRTVSR